MTAGERQYFAATFAESYGEDATAFHMLEGAGKLAMIPGKLVDWFLRHSGATDKGTARAVGHMVNDGLAVWGTTAAAKGLAKAAVNGVKGGIKAASKGVSIETSAANLDLAKPKYEGGLYDRLPRAPGIERHHMPADSVTDIPRSRGHAIQMDVADHAKTSSWGNSKKAQEYRDYVKSIVDSGNMRKAMSVEIWDVKNATRVKYNAAMQEMLEKSKQVGHFIKDVRK